MSLVAELLPSPEVLCRADFPFLLNARGFIRAAVEVGVDRGTFAKEILMHWKGRELYCIDPWLPYHDMPWNRDGDLLLAAITLAPFGDRIRLCRTTAAEFCAAHGIGSLLSFVYIDANHEYEAVMADLDLWWPQLPPNSILAGHDFDHEHLGVRRAVTEFAVRIGRPIRYTTSGEEPGSFYFYKEEPPSMIDVRNQSHS